MFANRGRVVQLVAASSLTQRSFVFCAGKTDAVLDFFAPFAKTVLFRDHLIASIAETPVSLLRLVMFVLW